MLSNISGCFDAEKFINSVGYEVKKYHMRKFLKSHWLISMILASVLTMLTIHILFKIPAVCEFFWPEWTAGDVLSFSGAIIGAVATIYVLQETVYSTAQAQREEREFAIRPYFTISVEEYSLAERQKDWINISNRSVDRKWQGNCSVIFKIRNVGTGNAILKSIKLSQEEVGNQEYHLDKFPVFMAGEEYVLYVNFCKAGNLLLEGIYSDIVELKDYRIRVECKIVNRNGKMLIQWEVSR